jgi:hypothetical protein
MALKRSITIDGTTYPDAYSRITTIRCDKADAYVYVCTYESEQARMDDAFPIYAEEHTCALADVASDLFPKAYEFLKTLPEFAGAIDC